MIFKNLSDSSYGFEFNSYRLYFFLPAESHAVENTGPAETLGNQMQWNTLQGSWTKNCKVDGLCGGGTRDAGNKCDTRDYKKGQPDYCGKCKYGWRRPMVPWVPIIDDWCCSWYDFTHRKDCKCDAKFAPECQPIKGEKLHYYCNIIIFQFSYKYRIIFIICFFYSYSLQETVQLKWNKDMDQVQEGSIMKIKVDMAQNCLVVP